MRLRPGRLRRARIAAAALVLGLFALAFAPWPGGSGAPAGALSKGQLFPALLSLLAAPARGAAGLAAASAALALGVAAAVVAAVAALTLLFGRLYCASLCPLGALQDLLAALPGRRRRRKARYAPSRWAVQGAVLAAAAAAALGGGGLLLGFLEPYSAFGKVAAGLWRPLLELANNAAAGLSRALGSYEAAYLPLSWEAARAGAGAAVLLLVGALSLFRGRLFCNLLCPSGAILRLLARRPRFGLRLDPAACTACGACERACRAACVRPRGGGFDEDRCVRCFDCLDACPTGAVSFGRLPRRWPPAARPATPGGKAAPFARPAASPSGDGGRRAFLRAAGLVLAAAGGGLAFGAAARKGRADHWGPMAPAGEGGFPAGGLADDAAGGAGAGRPRRPAAPPGAGTTRGFLDRCTACGTCSAICPSGVLRPSLFEWGLFELGKPYLAYDRAYCQFECDRCFRACPTGALEHLPLEEKKRRRLGKSVLALELCIVVAKGTRCGACAEHCPSGALSMRILPEGPLPRPVFDETLCIGCGACETVCPSLPRKAILVEGRAVQDLARVLEGRAGAAAQNAPLVPPEQRASGQSGAAGGEGGAEAGGVGGPAAGSPGGGSGGSDGFPF